MKTCKSCGHEKPLSEFGRNRARADGLSFYCKTCSRQKAREHAADPDRRERRRAYLADIYQNDPRRYLNYRYTARFGITVERYEELLRDQDGGCAICLTVPAPAAPRLAVDHDHACCPGKKSCGACVRGLLCGDCNRAIGLLRDDTEAIRRAASYLESHDLAQGRAS